MKVCRLGPFELGEAANAIERRTTKMLEYGLFVYGCHPGYGVD